jgi:uncharacterized Zn finger protein
MPLASKLAFRFDKRVQIKAQGLYAARAIEVIEESSQHFWAQVRSSGVYQVHLTYKQNSLVVSCECPNFKVRQKKSWVDSGSGSLPSE